MNGCACEKEDDGNSNVIGGLEHDDCSISTKNIFVLEEGGKPTLKFPVLPHDWKPAKVKSVLGVPEFPNVDYPGNWSEYSYGPKFKKASSNSRGKKHICTMLCLQEHALSLKTKTV